MTRLFPNPLSSDSVDKLNHKWMVVILLLLSLAAFIIPLHPGFQSQDQSTESSIAMPQSVSSKTPKLGMPKVNCWCPSAFTMASVIYTNAYCTNAFLSVLKGENKSSSIYKLEDSPIMTTKKVPSAESFKDYYDIIKNENENSVEREKIQSKIQQLVTFQTPLLLLVIAAILVVPQAVWNLLSDCCSPFNLAQALTSASHASAMDTDSRKQAYRELSTALSGGLSPSSMSLSCLYLVKKVLSIVAVIVLLFAVSMHVLPEIEDMENQLVSLTPASQVQGSPVDANTPPHLTGDPFDYFTYPNDTFVCVFGIMQLQNVAEYSVQCVATFPERADGLETTAQPWRVKTSKLPLSSKKNLLEFESCIFHMVTAVLAILAVANVLSLLGWLYKLVSTSSRNVVRLSGNAAMDTVLVVQMARINCGPHVAHRLAQSSAEFSKISPHEMAETL